MLRGSNRKSWEGAEALCHFVFERGAAIRGLLHRPLFGILGEIYWPQALPDHGQPLPSQMVNSVITGISIFAGADWNKPITKSA